MQWVNAKWGNRPTVFDLWPTLAKRKWWACTLPSLKKTHFLVQTKWTPLQIKVLLCMHSGLNWENCHINIKLVFLYIYNFCSLCLSVNIFTISGTWHPPYESYHWKVSLCVASWMEVIAPEGRPGVVLRGWRRNWIQRLWKWNRKKLDFI